MSEGNESPVEAQRTLTGARLREVAEYMDLFDIMVTTLYKPLADYGDCMPQGEEWESQVVVRLDATPEEARSVVKGAEGKQVQNDLRRWADELDKAAMTPGVKVKQSSPYTKVKDPLVPPLRWLAKLFGR